MSNGDIVRAWKNPEYRQRLSAEAQALVPEHPAGAIELADDELKQAVGGTDYSLDASTFTCCASLVVCLSLVVGGCPNPLTV